MRAPLLLVPLLFAACGGSQPTAQAAAPLPAASASTAASAPQPSPTTIAHYADPGVPVPQFTDPQRKEKILADVPQLDRHFEELATKQRFPGLAVGLVVDGEMVWSKGYGVRDLDSKQPVDVDTEFRLASITKSFTTVAVLQLRDAGKLSLDDPAQKYIPELAGLVYPTRDAPPITLRMLLTHMAGLPHDTPAPGLGEHPLTDGEILKSLQGMKLEFTPDVSSEYSNLGYELAGIIVSRVSGMPYADYVASHILRPLGMTSTGFAPDVSRLATGYMLEGDAMKHTPRLDIGADPAGGLFSTVRDLARYAAFQLSGWPPRDDADDGVLRRSSIREAQLVSTWLGFRVYPRAVGEPARASAIGYGFGWVHEETCDWDDVVWHNGGLSDGYHSVLYTLPDRGVAVVALTNTLDEPQMLERGIADALRLVDASGALAKRTLEPTPDLLAARDALLRLRDNWDDALAARVFVPEDAPDLPVIKQHFANDKELGACHVSPSSTTVDDALHMRWRMTCEHGGQRFFMGLSPDGKRLVDMRHYNNFPPDARLAAAATRLAALIQRWDDKAYDGIAATMPAGDRTHVKTAFADAATAHGSCKVDHADENGDKTHGHFVLACVRGGSLELEASLDDKSGKVSDVKLEAPSEKGKRCP